jgi:hypothetical protein
VLPSPTAAAQRFTEPARTSPAAKIPGRLVSKGAGERFAFIHIGSAATSVPVFTKPFLSRSQTLPLSSDHSLLLEVAVTGYDS